MCVGHDESLNQPQIDAYRACCIFKCYSKDGFCHFSSDTYGIPEEIYCSTQTFDFYFCSMQIRNKMPYIQSVRVALFILKRDYVPFTQMQI